MASQGNRGSCGLSLKAPSFTYQNLIVLVSKCNFYYSLNVYIKKKTIQLNFNGSFGG